MLCFQPPESDLVLLVPAIGTISLALYWTVVGHAKERRLERQAFYRSQLLQRMLDEGTLSEAFLREERERENEIALQRGRRARRLSGALLIGSSLALWIVLADKGRPEVAWLPGILGLVLVSFDTLLGARS